MSVLSQHAATAFMNHFLRGDVVGTIQAQPLDLYLALHLGDPTSAGLSSTELSGGSYRRQRITFAEPVLEGTEFYTTNRSLITFIGLPNSVVTYFGIWDAESGGRMWLSGAMTGIDATPTTAYTFNANDTLRIPAGILRVTF